MISLYPSFPLLLPTPRSALGRLPRFALRSLNGRFRRAPAATPVPSAVG
jgi:hypothetical protein